jgi:hypothetical protein
MHRGARPVHGRTKRKKRPGGRNKNPEKVKSQRLRTFGILGRSCIEKNYGTAVSM